MPGDTGNRYIHTAYIISTSFNFNKKKEPGVHEVMIGEKIIVEAVV